MKYKIWKLAIGPFEVFMAEGGEKRVRISTAGVTMEMPWVLKGEALVLSKINCNYAVEIRPEDESEIICISGVLSGVDATGYHLAVQEYSYVGPREDGGLHSFEGFLLNHDEYFPRNPAVGGLTLGQITKRLKDRVIEQVLQKVRERINA